MTVLLSDQRTVQSAEDVVGIRQAVRQRAVELGFNLVDQTKIVTAASELARKTGQQGGGGGGARGGGGCSRSRRSRTSGAGVSGSRTKTTARASSTSSSR